MTRCRSHDSLGAGAVPESVGTHVLDDGLAVVVLVSAGVLVGPFDGQDGALIVVHVAHIVASSVVVLGVKQPKGEGRI